MLLLSSVFISLNCMSAGSPLSVVCLRVSPSALLTLMVLSSDPRASRFCWLQAPLIIRLVCLPRIGIFLQKNIIVTHRWCTIIVFGCRGMYTKKKPSNIQTFYINYYNYLRNLLTFGHSFKCFHLFTSSDILSVHTKLHIHSASFSVRWSLTSFH